MLMYITIDAAAVTASSQKNPPETASSHTSAAKDQMATEGVRKRGWSRPNALGNSPSAARENMRRGESSIKLEFAPPVERSTAIVVRIPPAGPIKAEAVSATERALVLVPMVATVTNCSSV